MGAGSLKLGEASMSLKIKMLGEANTSYAYNKYYLNVNSILAQAEQFVQSEQSTQNTVFVGGRV